MEAGYQVALMAPTELLAEQHLRNFRHWLEPLGVHVEWLAGKQQGKARQQAMLQTLETTARMYRALRLPLIDSPAGSVPIRDRLKAFAAEEGLQI